MRHPTGVSVNRLVFLVVLLLVLQELHGTDIQMTGKELGVYITPEFNRAFLFCWDISAVGALTLNNQYTIKSGLALGTVGINFDIKGFVGGEAAPFADIPVSFGLDYQYNGLPEFENHTHSIVLLASYKRKRAGVSLGHNFRFTTFFGEAAIFEPVFACSVYVFFINNELLQLGLKASNFDDFTSGNIGAYFLNLNSVIRLNKKISLVNEIEIHQSGSIALASNFYGIVYRGGALFLW
jgi:hypothetical protein